MLNHRGMGLQYLILRIKSGSSADGKKELIRAA
jgi:hypothetical protein